MRSIPMHGTVERLSVRENQSHIIFGEGEFLFVDRARGFDFECQGFSGPTSAVRFREEHLQLRHSLRTGGGFEFGERVSFEILQQIHSEIRYEELVSGTRVFFQPFEHKTVLSECARGDIFSVGVEVALHTVSECRSVNGGVRGFGKQGCEVGLCGFPIGHACGLAGIAFGWGGAGDPDLAFTVCVEPLRACR